jgi:hypothetical protein
VLEAEILDKIEYLYSTRRQKQPRAKLPKSYILDHFVSLGISAEKVSSALSVLEEMGLVKIKNSQIALTAYALQAISNYTIRSILNPSKKTIHKIAKPLGGVFAPTPKGILSEVAGYTKAEVEKLFGGKWHLCYRSGKNITVFEENYTPQPGSKGYFRQNGTQFLRWAK